MRVQLEGKKTEKEKKKREKKRKIKEEKEGATYQYDHL